jgi:TonB family protein
MTCLAYDAVVRPRPLVLLLTVACAQTSTGPAKPEIITDCPAARDAEKALAAKAGRRPIPIIQKGQLLTDIADQDNRPQVTLAMLNQAQGAPLRATLKISVASDGHVEQVEVLQSSGVPSFDEALMAKAKTWRHRPYVVDCHPVPYVYPLNYLHRLGR